MVTLAEKLKLAKEVGMKKAAETIKWDIEAKAEIQRLTGLKFKPISLDEIEHKLTVKKLNCFEINHFEDPYSFLLVIGTIGFALTCAAFGLRGIHFCGAMLCSISITIISFSLFLFCEREVVKNGLAVMSIREWKDNLPYGGLLAIKEAKEAGLHNISIFYPVERWSENRIKDDPIIVGFSDKRVKLTSDRSKLNIKTRGKMYEIFAWDDGKIYE